MHTAIIKMSLKTNIIYFKGGLMQNWTIKELKKWLKTFDNDNSTMNYFLGGADQQTIDKAKAILKDKLNKG